MGHLSRTGKIEHWQFIAIYLALFDIVAVNLAYFMALILRHDFRWMTIPEYYTESWIRFVPIYTVICLIAFYFSHLYNSMWRFASYRELVNVTKACVITSAFHTIGITFLCRMPISYYMLGALFQFGLIAASRFAYRFLLLFTNRKGMSSEYKNVMLIGAGSAGQMILRDLHKAKELNHKVVCIIDDNSNKWGRFIDGVPIVGGREAIMENVEKYAIDEIYVAIPSAPAKERGAVLDICKETGCELKNLPGIFQIINGDVTVGNLKEVQIEDLLGREPIEVEMQEIFQFIQGKTILVTGGGGSIGSELCRQIAAHHPLKLIILDIYENNAHAIQLELRDKYPQLDLEVLIGSVRDSRKLKYVFEKYRPNVVYHAAAHKHVPLMEDAPCEAIKNNVIGTYKTAYAALCTGCERFVLISTDKAVNPVNIMGASKRLCEMVIQSFDKKIKEGKAQEIPEIRLHMDKELDELRKLTIPKNPQTGFVAVRFGNVLGSNGSVIPRFKEQIAKGGPVTVTHPDIIRYFMTIPEAVRLVLTAGTYANGGEIFVLDMGVPVKIDTLARNMIKLSGYKPDIDIPVIYTGLRPGEKLYEEKLMAEEGMKKTKNQLIHIGNPIPFDHDAFLKDVQQLMIAAYQEREDISELVEKVVPTYHPAGRHGK